MKDRQEREVSLIQTAITLFDETRHYRQTMEGFGSYFKQIQRFFCVDTRTSIQKKHFKDENLKRIYARITKFTKELEQFCKDYRFDETVINSNTRKSSDFYLALVIELLKAFNQIDNYHFVFMGIPCKPQNFDNNVKLLRKVGDSLQAAACLVFLFITAALLFTQPITIPSIIALLLTLTLLTLFINYCGSMIHDNCLPFSTAKNNSSGKITQRFGYFEAIQKDDDLECSEILSEGFTTY